MTGNTVTVERTGKTITIPEDDLRRGDVLLLQAGDLVLADVKLVDAAGLEVDEWELTGEIAPAAKRVCDEDVFIYRGSKVTRGSGRGIVVATGPDTEYAELLSQPWERATREAPTLVKGRYLVLPLLLLLPAAVLAVRQQVALVVVGVGAGLFLILTLILQNGPLFRHLLVESSARRLARRGVHIHDPAALEVLGHLDLVCFDKTGVLTTQALEVKQVHFADAAPTPAWFSSGNEMAALTGVGCALCNDVIFRERLEQADPIDQALAAFASRAGFRITELAGQYRRIYDKPFDSETRYMAAGFEHDGQALYFVKGDPDIIVQLCQSYRTAAGAEQKTDQHFHRFIRTTIEAITHEGNIVIALACRVGAAAVPPERYSFLCLIELENPLRPGVPEVIAQLKEAGIRTIMLTGDRPETASGVSRKARLDPHPEFLLTGKHMARMGFSDIAWQSAYVSIFARLLPSQKGVLVRLFQQNHHLVAMVGDGPNDAVALRVADVGISLVEDSSPVARSVSQVLINDLTDLVTLIQSARRIQVACRILTAGRAVALLTLAAGLYAWLLA